MRTLLIATASALAAFWVSPAAAASFDCNGAQSPDELAVCSNSDLSRQDEAMAAAYRQALKKAADRDQVKTVARNALVARQACQWNEKCIADAMANAMKLYKAALSGDYLGNDKINYGSRAGMQVTVLSRRGIGTANAVITVRHAYDDVVAYCRDYELNVTPKCIAEESAIKLASEIHADCSTGTFDTLGGQRYRLLGKRPEGEEGAAFRVVEEGSTEELGDYMASGYYTAMGQLSALCPQFHL